MANSITNLLSFAKKGFSTLKVASKYKNRALVNLKTWLSNEMFIEYFPQIEHLIKNKDWDYLLDCFYQIIPFGTGGRRGEVGIGPNRINKWTIQSSAQGHSQYLKKIYGEEVSKRGTVLSFGIREFFTNKHFSDNLPNPTRNLKGVDLAKAAAEVYVGNNIKVFLFAVPRSTPELSFAIRYLNACAGDMFDASHNPPEHNGKKVYDEFGGQLIPPDDEKLVSEVTKNVKEIKRVSLESVKNTGLLKFIGPEIDLAYIDEATKVSLSKNRKINIVYTPLHGVGSSSVLKCLKKLGFKVLSDPKTSFQSGKFENVTFNIPNPEVVQSFDTTLDYAKKVGADIILNSDPDADRIGIMVNHGDQWIFLNGNEIGALLTDYVIKKKKEIINGVVIKTTVTTSLATSICKENNLEMIGELPVGFKYIAQAMNKLEKEGKIRDFLLGIEESNGYIAGNYVRDKDASIAAIWLAELAAELKSEKRTIVDYLTAIYSRYGYFRNDLTEIRLPGAEGMEQIQKIQTILRSTKPRFFGEFKVGRIDDFLDMKPIVSNTDRSSKDLLVFYMEPTKDVESMKVTVRPSGTEPKIKLYFELGTKPFPIDEYSKIQLKKESLLKKFERAVMKLCYEIIGIDFPDRGFLLFWQMPLRDKLRFFEVEEEIVNLKKEPDKKRRLDELFKLLEFLGKDPIEKVDLAFKAKNKKGVREYLSL